MRASILTKWSLTTLFSTLLVASSIAQVNDAPTRNPLPDWFSAKLYALFQKYYPKASFTHRDIHEIHIDYELKTFVFPPANPGGKHQNPVQLGPKQGGIKCSVYLEEGKYAGQLSLGQGGKGQFRARLLRNKKMFMQLLAAPYSAKRNQSLWVSLSYPSDASEDFLKEFHALLQEFEDDMH